MQCCCVWLPLWDCESLSWRDSHIWSSAQKQHKLIQCRDWRNENRTTDSQELLAVLYFFNITSIQKFGISMIFKCSWKSLFCSPRLYIFNYKYSTNSDHFNVLRLTEPKLLNGCVFINKKKSGVFFTLSADAINSNRPSADTHTHTERFTIQHKLKHLIAFIKYCVYFH